MKKLASLVCVFFSLLFLTGAKWLPLFVTAGGGAITVCGSGWTGPTSGLTHCWPLDNAHVSGTTIQDAIGSINGTAGANVVAATGPSGLANSARAYDGSTQPILLASDPLPLTQPVTIATWVNETTGTGNDGDPRLLCFADASVAFTLATSISPPYIDVNGALYGTSGSSTTTISTSTWHHYAVTYNGTSLLIYFDGVSQTVGATQGDGCTSSNTWVLGGMTATNRLWAGSQATTVMYNRALSGAEITTLFNAF